jgi:hypothetical protein
VTGLGGCDAGVCTLRPCTDGCSRCTENATPCHTPTTKHLDLFGPEEIAVLKAELEQVVGEMSTYEERVAEQLQPQSVEEAGQLEESLTAALEEVRARRAELEQRNGPR